MRRFILPLPTLLAAVFIAAMILLAEWGIASSTDAERVVATGAHCTGKSLAADRTLSLLLACDTPHPARTADPATIKRFVEAPATPLVCTVHKSGDADCSPHKNRARKSKDAAVRAAIAKPT
jgi:hypothetical protein